ncbi:MAG: hypothetical protein Q7T53_11080 [Deltaproteobacteria bacterium]|nr:hypothetical protein [Deltaproteobacteria bacterium]
MFRELVFAIVLTSMVGIFAGCATSEYATSDYERRAPSQHSGHSHQY